MDQEADGGGSAAVAPAEVGRARVPRPVEAWLAWSPWLALAIFVMATGIAMIADHWTPVGDDAMITSFSLDVVSSDPPTLGMPTSLSLSTGTPVRHPGPLPFWLVGPPAKLLGAPGYGVAIAVVATNVGLLAMGAVACARLRPRGLGPVVAVFCGALILNGLGAEGVVRPFNPYFGVLAALIAMVSAWSAMAGNAWALPIFVATGSLAAQAHVTYLPVIAALVVLVVVVLAVDHRRPRRRDLSGRISARMIALSAGLGTLLWAGPIIDQAVGTGNLLALLRGSGSTEAAGWRYGAEQLVHAVAPTALWTGSVPGGSLPSPSGLRWVVAAMILGTLVGVAVWAARSGQRSLLALSATALTGALGSTVVSARLPVAPWALESPVNRLHWWPVGCMVWLAVVAVGVLIVTRALEHRTRFTPTARASLTRGVIIVSFIACGVLGAQLLGSASGPDSEASIIFGAVRQHAQAIDEVTPPDGTVLLQAPDVDLQTYTFTQSLIGHLRLRGIDVQVDVVDAWGYFTAYRKVHPTEGPVDVAVFVRGTPSSPPPPRGSRLLSRYDPKDPPAAFRGFDSLLALGGGGKPSDVYLVPATSDDR